MAWDFEADLPGTLYEHVMTIALRDMRKKLTAAMACAVRAKRDRLDSADLKPSHVKQARSIGLMAG
jgi:hypothetical protein